MKRFQRMLRSAIFPYRNYFNFQYASLLIILFFAYYFAGKFGLMFASTNPSASLIWPPAGIALAAFLLFGKKVWPAVFVGAFFVNITTQGTIATSLGIALGNTLESLLAWHLVNNFAEGKNAFHSVSGVVKYIFFAGFLSPMIAATTGTVVLRLGGFLSFNTLSPTWVTWWLGDMGAMLLVAPSLLLWISGGLPEFTLKKALQVVSFYFCIVILTSLIFSGILPYAFLIVPLLLWGAFKFSQRDQAIGLLMFVFLCYFYTLHGKGPYATSVLPLNQALLRLQIFLSTIVGTVFWVAALVIERQESRGALQKSEQKFRSLIEKSFDAIVLIDSTTKIIYASPSVKRILGYKPRELIGVLGMSFVVPESKKYIQEELHQLLTTPGETKTVVYQAIRKDKKRIWIEVTGTNYLNDATVNGIIVNFRDITDAIEVDRVKSEFVSFASHQLKTPLTTINWHIEHLIKKGLQNFTVKDQQYIHDIYNASRRVMELVNVFLNVSRLEFGTFFAQSIPFKYETVINSVVRDFRQEAQKRNIQIKTHISSLPAFEGDPRLYAIIVQNLLSNAFLYSANGAKIFVDISVKKKGIQLQIIDNGLGIPKSEQSHIFTKLFRAKNVKDSDLQGIGLGLYIVHSVVTTTGGKISFESKQNKGTIFTVWYPLKGMKKEGNSKIVKT